MFIDINIMALKQYRNIENKRFSIIIVQILCEGKVYTWTKTKLTQRKQKQSHACIKV